MKRVGVVLFVGIMIISCNQNVDSDYASQEVKDSIDVTDLFEIDYSTDFSEIGFQLMETEMLGELKLQMNVEAVEKIVGEPHDITKFEFWGVDGYEHQSRFYQDSTIDVNYIKLDDGNMIIDRILIDKNPNYKTTQDVGVGSTQIEVLKAYKGKISNISDDNIVAGSIYGGLFFYLNDGKVTSLYLGAGAE